MAIRSVITWPVRQVRGFAANLGAVVTETRIGDVLPPWIIATLSWFRDQFPRALGYGTAQQQITASIILAIAMVISSFGLLTPVALVMLIPMTVGFWRLVPVVDDYWPLGGDRV